MPPRILEKPGFFALHAYGEKPGFLIKRLQTRLQKLPSSATTDQEKGSESFPWIVMVYPP